MFSAIFKIVLMIFTIQIFTGCDNKKSSEEDFVPDPIPFVLKDGFFHKNNGESTEKMFIAGVNLGIGVPGTMAGHLAAQKEDYLRWFAQMTELGFNTLRTYTIHYPRFYEALAEYNETNPDKPIYLFHGIWLDEEDIENGDLYNITDHFDDGIKEAVDVAHGNAEIGHRFGRAYGNYTTNISNWIIGWIIGREVSPFEVSSTNFHNPEETSFHGTFFKIENCDPIESWFSARIDYLATYEFENYRVKRPLSSSSWPTLDPLRHRTEGELSFEDTNQIDLAPLDDSKFEPGYFASYHAYPYYPNFMNNEPSFNSYYDDYGKNNYIGYLKKLREHYGNKPLIIAEFGVPSSIGNAHYSVSGMHHGGHDEIDQGIYTARMFENIRDTECAGGLFFAWLDEWWKRTWITDEVDFPPERRSLWHNITAAEQNFGIISFEPAQPEFRTVSKSGNKSVSEIKAAADLRYFHLKIELGDQFDKISPLILGIDTYKEDAGESILPDGTQTEIRSEFALVISENSAELFVTEAYNLYGIWHYTSGDEQLYRSIPTDGAPWKLVKWKNSGEHGSDDGRYYFPDFDQEIGRVRFFEGSIEDADHHDTVILDKNTLHIRIPWTLLHFTDPSALQVMDDDRDTLERETAITEGIKIVASANGEISVTERFIWEPWDTAPEYSERKKDSFFVLKDFSSSFDPAPVKHGNLIANRVMLKHEWGDNDASFSNETISGCEFSKVTITEITDGEAGWYFEPLKLEQGWYEYSDFSQSDGRSRTILSCGFSKFYNIGQSHFSYEPERVSARFFVDEDCEYTVIRVLDRTGNLSTCQHELRKIDPVELHEPVVSITFDDIYFSAATDGAVELEKRGMRGTFFVTKDYTLSGEEKYADEKTVIDLHLAGHEIGFHGVKHPFFSTYDFEDMEIEFEEGLSWLNSLGVQDPGFAFPFGDFDERVVSLSRKYFSYGRSSIYGMNDSAFSRYELKIFPVTTDTTLDEMVNFVSSVEINNVWGIFLFHDLGNSGSDYHYETSLDDYIALLDEIQKRNVAVKPVKEIIDAISLSPF
jgi:peptidoglycan/xylan/chitin deacetylase (PgdA/CDA1 family)